jgi:hypothetical protein
LTELIYKGVVEKENSKKSVPWFKFTQESPKNQYNRKKAIGKYFNCHFEKFINSEFKKNSTFAYYKNIVWRSYSYDNDNNEKNQEEDGRFSSYIFNCSGESRSNSVGEDMALSCNHLHAFESRNSTRFANDNSPNRINHHPYGAMGRSTGHSFEGHHQLTIKLCKVNSKFDDRYSQDYIYIGSMDFLKVIHKYSSNFLNNREFRCLYLPDTKNFSKLSRGNSFDDRITMTNNFRLSYSETMQEFNTTNNFKHKLKIIRKNIPAVLCVVFIIILLLIAFYD